MKIKTPCPNCQGGWIITEVYDEKTVCPNCNSITEFKRRVGIWTFIFGVMTCGLSLLLIPLYRPRCFYCNHPIDNSQKAS